MKINKIIGAKTKIILFPFIYLILIILVGVATLYFGVNKILEVRRQINSTKVSINTLEEKYQALSKGGVSEYAKVASLALPGESPSLFMISQLKSLTDKQSVVFSDLKMSAGASDSQDIISVPFSFTARSEPNNILLLLNNMSEGLPLVTFSEFEIISADETTLEVDISASTYWAPFPQDIPAVTERIRKLDENTILMLEKYSKIEIEDDFDLQPSGSSGRTNPFSL